MKSSVVAAAAFFVITASQSASAATLTVSFHDGSPNSDMQGEFVLDYGVPVFGIGPTGDYLYYQHANEGQVRFHVRGELSLELPIQVVVVVPKANGHLADSVEIQTFTSDLPNDWHMKLIFSRNDGSWLGHSASQPTDFSIAFDSATLEVWFTDEFTPVRGYFLNDLVIGTPPNPNPIPIPSAVLMLGTALGGLAFMRRQAT